MASALIGLYRDKKKGKLGGVCAGLADKLGIEPWLVRILAVTALLFTSFLTLILYIAAWLMLEDKPAQVAPEAEHIKATAWRTGLAPDEALSRLEQRLQGLNGRIANMEQLLTSEEFRVRRAFSDLDKPS